MSDLRVFRGDDASYSIEVTAADGVTPTDITGATLKFTAKERRTDADGAAIVALATASGIVHDDEPNGLATLTIPASATDAMTTERALEYDLQITGSGGEIRTLRSGRLFVLLDVTRTG